MELKSNGNQYFSWNTKKFYLHFQHNCISVHQYLRGPEHQNMF